MPPCRQRWMRRLQERKKPQRRIRLAASVATCRLQHAQRNCLRYQRRGKLTGNGAGHPAAASYMRAHVLSQNHKCPPRTLLFFVPAAGGPRGGHS
jgi:hypothetical protein